MKWLDNFLQDARIGKADQFIKAGSVVLDIGSDEGILFKKSKKIKYGIGVDPNLEKNFTGKNFSLLKGKIPGVALPVQKFDAITLLAVLEHIPEDQQVLLASACFDLLYKKGLVIITVPSPKVDLILLLLKKIRLIDGMSLEEHHGFDVKNTQRIFSENKFRLIVHTKFQLGLNNLIVFQANN